MGLIIVLFSALCTQFMLQNILFQVQSYTYNITRLRALYCDAMIITTPKIWQSLFYSLPLHKSFNK